LLFDVKNIRNEKDTVKKKSRAESEEGKGPSEENRTIQG
jgi:hypothetical protein